MAWALAARELREAPKMAWIAATVLPEARMDRVKEISETGEDQKLLALLGSIWTTAVSIGNCMILHVYNGR